MKKFLETRRTNGTGLPARITDVAEWKRDEVVDVYVEDNKIIMIPHGRNPENNSLPEEEKALYKITDYSDNERIVRLSPTSMQLLSYIIEEFDINLDFDRVNDINVATF